MIACNTRTTIVTFSPMLNWMRSNYKINLSSVLDMWYICWSVDSVLIILFLWSEWSIWRKGRIQYSIMKIACYHMAIITIVRLRIWVKQCQWIICNSKVRIIYTPQLNSVVVELFPGSTPNILVGIHLWVSVPV